MLKNDKQMNAQILEHPKSFYQNQTSIKQSPEEENKQTKKNTQRFR